MNKSEEITLTGSESRPTNRFATARRPGMSAKAVVEIVGLSHQGLVRPNNEDSFLASTMERRIRTLTTNLPPNQTAQDYAEIAYGMVIADGMGGAAAGEVASRTAIATLVDLVVETPDWIMRLDEDNSRQILKRIDDRIKKLAEALTAAAERNPRLSGMGTTLTLAVSLGSDLLIAHVGDSRAYLFTQGELVRLTKDQTMAQLLLDLGVISPDDLTTHGGRHVLTSAITAENIKIEAELHHLYLASGDQLLLCSDGLTEMATDNYIKAVLTENKSADESCQALVNGALAGGGKDNVTVILARYQFPEI
jgi:serine/threonine protein phosphatase PrpC